MNNFCFLNLFTYITYNALYLSFHSTQVCFAFCSVSRIFDGISRVALFMGCTKSHQNLMNSINYVNIKLTKLIMTCLDLRNNLLSNHHDVT